MSTILNIVVLFYACTLFIDVWKEKATGMTTDVKWFDINTPKHLIGFNFAKAGFDIGVGFTSSEDIRRIGDWEIDYVLKYKNGTKDKDRASVVPCNSVRQNWTNPGKEVPDKNTWRFNNLTCTDAVDNKIGGQYFSTEFRYISFKLKKCNETAILEK